MPDFSIDPALLDDIDGDAALTWAAAWSNETEQRTAASRDTARLSTHIRSLLDTDSRIPYVSRRGDYLYNFWRDQEHPRGLWRRTTTDAYLGNEGWEVLLDVDKLAAAEGEDWVFKGASVRPLVGDRALIRLSRGGADAVVVREFDLTTRTFDGFEIPEAKTDTSWVDRDTLLVGTDLGGDSLTTSGYPAEVRLWRRGTELTDAPIQFRGDRTDIAVGAHYDPTPGYERTIFTRALDFYNQRTFINDTLLDVPTDTTPIPHRQWLFLLPRTEFAGLNPGELGVIELDRFLAGDRDVHTLVSGTAVEDISFTASSVLVTTLDDVTTRISSFDLGTWERTEVELPDAATAHVVSTSPLDGDEVWINSSSFTTPSTLLRNGEVARCAPSLFDASSLETRQHWATSADGTKIPYFITGDFSRLSTLDAPGGGPRPTLVGGYGGFEVSLTPSYSAVRGAAWLERGYFYVQPNLRGGGEFGPEWHSQAVKTNRHKVWEDHRAVLEDLVARGYTTPAQLGIRGGSNGGLLTSGALVQYPELFGAAVIQVPLTDMLRYHTLSAGASWMAEYGDPDDPEERAAIETWSPLHNISPASNATYPPALVTTSTRDDRVHPAHARTFALALAKAGHPVDYFENTVGGHAGAADNEQVARVEALIYSWLDIHIGD